MTDDDRGGIETLVACVRRAQGVGAPAEELRELASTALQAIRGVLGMIAFVLVCMIAAVLALEVETGGTSLDEVAVGTVPEPMPNLGPVR